MYPKAFAGNLVYLSRLFPPRTEPERDLSQNSTCAAKQTPSDIWRVGSGSALYGHTSPCFLVLWAKYAGTPSWYFPFGLAGIKATSPALCSFATEAIRSCGENSREFLTKPKTAKSTCLPHRKPSALTWLLHLQQLHQVMPRCDAAGCLLQLWQHSSQPSCQVKLGLPVMQTMMSD